VKIPIHKEVNLDGKVNLFVGFNYAFGRKNKNLQRKQREDNTKQGGGLF
jgi:hypothetical protein